MTKPTFENLDSLLETIRMHMRSEPIKQGRVILQGQFYHKPYLSALGTPTVVKPNSFSGNNLEKDCEIYVASYGGGQEFLAILPLKDNSERDMREPIFTIKTELIEYFLFSKIGYKGFKEMIFPDSINVIKSLVQFPVDGFEEMSSDETMTHAKKIDFYLCQENYSLRVGTNDKYAGWKKQMGEILLTQIKADNGWTDNFNPMYFLAIHRPEN